MSSPSIRYMFRCPMTNLLIHILSGMRGAVAYFIFDAPSFTFYKLWSSRDGQSREPLGGGAKMLARALPRICVGDALFSVVSYYTWLPNILRDDASKDGLRMRTCCPSNIFLLYFVTAAATDRTRCSRPGPARFQALLKHTGYLVRFLKST